jgi:hypothetical protein
VKILAGCPYFHIKYIRQEKGLQNHPNTLVQCLALSVALSVALAVAFDHSAVKKPIKWIFTMLQSGTPNRSAEQR